MTIDWPAVIYDDDSLVVINKPPNWVVHAGAGAPPENGGLITDWLIKNYPDVAHWPWPDADRPGIVHRLDKDTSGAMVLAKNPDVWRDLQTQFKERTVKKVYLGVVWGQPKEPSGTITVWLGRHPKHRQQMAARPWSLKTGARQAVTDYRVLASRPLDKDTLSLVEFSPITGRTHQLRVSAKHSGWPILGDSVYHTKPSRRLSQVLGLSRQLLHAKSLTFRHPLRHKRLTFVAVPPQEFDLVALTNAMRLNVSRRGQSTNRRG